MDEHPEAAVGAAPWGWGARGGGRAAPRQIPPRCERAVGGHVSVESPSVAAGIECLPPGRAAVADERGASLSPPQPPPSVPQPPTAEQLRPGAPRAVAGEAGVRGEQARRE